MFKYLFQHIILDTLYFPIWWYTRGFLKVLNWAKLSLQDMERMLALKIWLKSMFAPMFQDTTREGRIISLFMRTVLLLFKLLGLILWIIMLAILIILWLAIPIIIIALTLHSFGIDFIPWYDSLL